MTRENMNQLQSLLDVCHLPRVFQDTIELAQRLHVAYVWIDASCIVQNDKEDINREVSSMGEIYRNSYCNLAAIAATDDPQAGLFVDRDPLTVSAFTIPIHRLGYHRTYHGYTKEMFKGVNAYSLQRRGWVFQERLLSPRTVYFGRQLSWECSNSIAFEIFLEHASEDRQCLPKGSTIYRLKRLLRGPSSERERLTERQLQRAGWWRLVQKFTHCELTDKNDRLPAIAGLAKQFSEYLEDQYVAGFWKKTLVIDLLWVRPWGLDWNWALDTVICERSRECSTIRLLAPSWSWASVDFAYAHICKVSHHYHIYAEVQGIDLVSGPTDFGRVTHGTLTISGCLVKSYPMPDKQRKAKQIRFDFSRKLGGPVMDIYDISESLWDTKPTNIFHFLLLGSYIDILWSLGRKLHGLILEATGRIPHEYRRLGVFTHPTGLDGPDYGPENTRAREAFPEFADFDPDNYEKTTITIV
ncbi:heterokaryon incompatibility protein-domain-containing protein [Massariosphaeria phaeospora]|uniref:Heterokaryon incompatibility protein-domain-containing protein n=1 Tax=Massariosphaeria phaeospora TaxID=100035 RepID=A0A7C8MKR4_9PLEO|nr:heterokaryon incompatibility protein-domain-containing protein [Massariosphaeria phaeospora]